MEIVSSMMKHLSTFGSRAARAAGLAVVMALAAGAGSLPAAQAAAAPVVVAPTLSPSDCGKYTTATTIDLAAAVTSATGGTILVCPGTYTVNEMILQPNTTKLTIRRANTAPGFQPIIQVTSGSAGILAQNATGLTLDGVVLDMTGDAAAPSYGLYLNNSSATLKNVTIASGTGMDSGVYIDNTVSPTTKTVTMTGGAVLGCVAICVHAIGHTKLIVSGALINSTDNGRFASPVLGIEFDNLSGLASGPTGSVTGSRLVNVSTGVALVQSSGVTIGKNTITYTFIGVGIMVQGGGSASNTKITGNNLSGPSTSLAGIEVSDVSPSATSASLKTTISGNIIEVPYVSYSSYGVVINSALPAATFVTATVTGNTFTGIPVSQTVYNANGYATVTASKNAHVP